MVLLSAVFWGGVIGCEQASKTDSAQYQTRQAAAGDSEDDGKGGSTWTADDFPFGKFRPLPPFIPRPLHSCSPKVYVEGALKNALVHLYDPSGTRLDTGVAGARGTVTFDMGHPLTANTGFYATQEINGIESAPSSIRRVESLKEELGKPRITEPVWECGRRVGTKGLTPGTLVRLFEDGTKVDEAWVTKGWRREGDLWPILTSTGLGPIGAKMTVDQIYCPEEVPGETTQTGPMSDPEPAVDSPSKLPKIGKVEALEGTSLLKIDGFYFAALQRYYEIASGNRDYMGGLWTPRTKEFNVNVGRTIDGNNGYDATQTLCPGSTSDPTSATIIEEPVVRELASRIKILEPICPGADAIRVWSEIGGRVYLLLNGQPLGTTYVNGGVSIIGIPAPLLQAGDDLELYQVHRGAHGSNIVGSPAQATVGSGNQFERLGEKTYHDPNSGETLRGYVRDGDNMSTGPEFALTCCGGCEQCGECSEEEIGAGECLVESQQRTALVEIRIDGEPVTEVTLYERHSGYYTGLELDARARRNRRMASTGRSRI